MKKFSMLTAIILIVAACTVNIFAYPAAAYAEAERTSAPGDYDFSTGETDSDITLAPSELLPLFTGAAASSEELSYLDSRSTLSFSYTADIPSDKVVIRRPADSEHLYVFANAYTQENTKNGVSVTWIPKSASLGLNTADFSAYDGEYAYLATPAALEEGSVTVTYEASFTFSASAVNEICTLAYKDAEAASSHIKDEEERYEALLAEYEQNCVLRRQYLEALAEYESKLPIYEEYIAECERISAAYGKELLEYAALMDEYRAAYAEYERLYAEYEKKLEAYNRYINVTKPEYDKAYAEYVDYINKKEVYDAEMELYLAYLASAEGYLKQLNIINLSKTPMTNGRTLYDAVMGNTVTQVLERANEIKDAIPGGTVPVTRARQATIRLRNFFNSYFAAAGNEARYICYSDNYAKGFYMKKSFIDLFQALDFLYKVDLVYNMLAEQGKAEKYVILLSQLYIVTTALSDEPVYNYENTVRFTDSYTWTYVDEAGKKHSVTPIQMLEGNRYLNDEDRGTPFTAPFPEEVAEPAEPALVPYPEPVEKLTEPIPPKAPELLPDEPATPVYPEEVKMPVCPELVEEPTEPSPYIPNEGEKRLALWLSEGKLVRREEQSAPISIKREAEIKKLSAPADGATVYFYPSDTASQPILAEDVPFGEAAVFTGEEPLRASDEKYHYSFIGWAYSDGTPAELENIGTGHVYLYPVFKKHDKNETFTVTWHVGEKAITAYVRVGELPIFSGTPARERDELYYYEFSSWDKELEPVFEDCEYTACFTPVRYYKITWLAGGEVFAVSDCIEGKLPTPPEAVPVIPDDSYGRYSFSGWGTLLPASADASYEADFDITRYYIINWKLNGEILASTRCLENEIPVPPISFGDVVLDDGDILLSLEGWDRDPVPPTADTSYEAICSALHYYTVRFIADGKVILSEKYLECDTPKPPAAPSLPDTEFEKYSFVSWDKEITQVFEDTDYTAVFDVTKLYSVSWLVLGQPVLTEKYPEGEIPVYSGEVPTRADDSMYKYSFSGWDKPSSPVAENTVYNAEFSSEYLLPLGSSGAQLTYAYGRLTVDITASGACEINDFSALLSLAGERRLGIITPYYTLGISPETLSLMKTLGVKRLSFSDDGGFFVGVFDEDGEAVFDSLSFTIDFAEEKVPVPLYGGAMHLVMQKDGAGYEIKSVTLGTNSVSVSEFLPNTIYKYAEFFEINVSAGSEWLSVKTLAALGETVELVLDIPEGMKLSVIYYIEDASGGKTSITDKSFVMPPSDIRLSLSLVPEVFSVKFVLFGGLVIERRCEWGKLPAAPEPPVGADSEYTYSFISWDKELEEAYSDVVYTAEYAKTPIPVAEESETDLFLSYLVTVYRFRVLLIVSASFAVLSVPALIFFKKYRKKHPIS